MKKGFTLVELSIVLVIIGLLIGGILVGQSLIESAKVNATVQQIQQFDAGVMAFKDRYKSLPGDSTKFGGNGNGAIEGYPNNSASLFSYEIGRFWNNVFPSQYTAMGNDVAGYRAVSTGVGKNVVLSKMGESGSFFYASALTDGTSNLVKLIDISNYYGILHSTQLQTIYGGSYQLESTSTNSLKNSAVRPIDLAAFDQKLDDGLPDSGFVLSGRLPNLGGVGGFTKTGSTLCSSGGAYVLSQPLASCTPLIRIGGTTGVTL